MNKPNQRKKYNDVNAGIVAPLAEGRSEAARKSVPSGRYDALQANYVHGANRAMDAAKRGFPDSSSRQGAAEDVVSRAKTGETASFVFCRIRQRARARRKGVN